MKITKRKWWDYIIRVWPTCLNFEFWLTAYKFIRNLYKLCDWEYDKRSVTSYKYHRYEVTRDSHWNGYRIAIMQKRDWELNYMMSMRVKIDKEWCIKLMNNLCEITGSEKVSSKAYDFLSSIDHSNEG